MFVLQDVNLKGKMCGAGPRKLSVISSARIKLVSVKRASCVPKLPVVCLHARVSPVQDFVPVILAWLLGNQTPM